MRVVAGPAESEISRAVALERRLDRVPATTVEFDRHPLGEEDEVDATTAVLRLKRPLAKRSSRRERGPHREEERFQLGLGGRAAS